MTLQEIIESVAMKYPHSCTNADIVKIINQTQRELFRRLYKPETATQYDLVADNPFYPIGFSSHYIIDVLVNGVKYGRKSPTAQAANRFYYVMDDNTVGLYPTPTEDASGGLVVFHYGQPAELVADHLGVTPDFDKDYHMLIVYRVCKELAENAMDDNMGNYFISQINGLEQEYSGSTYLQSYEIQMPEWGC